MLYGSLAFTGVSASLPLEELVEDASLAAAEEADEAPVLSAVLLTLVPALLVAAALELVAVPEDAALLPHPASNTADRIPASNIDTVFFFIVDLLQIVVYLNV
jgi:hypothetical protein